METEIRQHEFGGLEKTAARYLTDPRSLPKAAHLDGWYQRMRLWHCPAFDVQLAWIIFQKSQLRGGSRDTQLRQVCWNRPADIKRLSDPLQGLAHGFHSHPTMEVRDRPLVTADFESRLAALRKISFPVFSDKSLGLDGESFGIELTSGRIHVEWWCEGPEEWRMLTAWAAETRSWLAVIASTEARSQP